MKACSVCGLEKSAEEFQRRLASKDGLTAACKCCLSERDRNRNSDPKRMASRRAYQATEKGKAAHAAAIKTYRKRNTKKLAAHNAVAKALARGKLKRLPCFICGEMAEAHHPDYDRPLDVIWLCMRHHKEAHALTRNEEQAEAA